MLSFQRGKLYIYGYTNASYVRDLENFGAFTGAKEDFSLILLLLNMGIRKSFTVPTCSQ